MCGVTAYSFMTYRCARELGGDYLPKLFTPRCPGAHLNICGVTHSTYAKIDAFIVNTKQEVRHRHFTRMSFGERAVQCQVLFCMR